MLDASCDYCKHNINIIILSSCACILYNNNYKAFIYFTVYDEWLINKLKKRKDYLLNKSHGVIIGESAGAKPSKSSKKGLRALSPPETVKSIEEDSPKVSRISESNVVVRVKNVNRNQSQKVSTGCGPSPPKEIEPTKSQHAKETVIEPSRPKTPLSDTGRRETTSTGTSPLPQSISTQVSKMTIVSTFNCSIQI